MDYKIQKVLLIILVALLIVFTLIIFKILKKNQKDGVKI